MESKSKSGKVYLVGAGPGDLGLVTLRAKKCIESADVIVYDHLANPEMLSWARDDAEIIYAGKEAGEPSPSQQGKQRQSPMRESNLKLCRASPRQSPGQPTREFP
jgi:siroheme synthase